MRQIVSESTKKLAEKIVSLHSHTLECNNFLGIKSLDERTVLWNQQWKSLDLKNDVSCKRRNVSPMYITEDYKKKNVYSHTGLMRPLLIILLLVLSTTLKILQ